MIRAALLASILLAAPTFAADPPKITLKDGDRIVYLGNTFAERDANYGYLETLLTIRHPDINFTFRNLGWSGDTVWGDARARFGTRADGFKHLKEHVLALKPTIILVAYGMNESFAGEAGLKEFEAGLNTLLDTLAETKAKIVLISPIPHENLGPPLPDPAKHNAELRLYRDVMAKVAKERESRLVDLIALMDRTARLNGPNSYILTEDGVQPTDFGLFTCASAIVIEATDTPISDGPLRLSFDKEGTAKLSGDLDGSEIIQAPHVVRISGTTPCLPGPLVPSHRPPPRAAIVGGYSFSILRPEPGTYDLRIDGNPIAHMTVAVGEPRSTVRIQKGPEIDQVEKLRALINRKNELYFHRWRPQNETYLFGFRKHEQGNNAVEIPQFDPLIADLEAQINILKKPVKHTYEIIREEPAK